MKSILEMDKDEITNLVSFTGSGESSYIFYYSNIKYFSGTQMMYNGELINIKTAESLEELLAGKANYELYVLQAGSNNLETIIASRVNEILSSYVQNKMNDTEQAFSETTSELAKDMKELITAFNNDLGEFTRTNAKLSEFSDKAQKLNGKLSSAIKDIDTNQLEPVKQEFDKTVQKLKSLFN